MRPVNPCSPEMVFLLTNSHSYVYDYLTEEHWRTPEVRSHPVVKRRCSSSRENVLSRRLHFSTLASTRYFLALVEGRKRSYSRTVASASLRDGGRLRSSDRGPARGTRHTVTLKIFSSQIYSASNDDFVKARNATTFLPTKHRLVLLLT